MLLIEKESIRIDYRALGYAGNSGVGKSVIAGDSLESLRNRKGYLPQMISFSAQTQAQDTQMLMESKLEKKRKTKYEFLESNRYLCARLVSSCQVI